MDVLTPLTPDERALLLRKAEEACAAKTHFGGSQSLFWLRRLCKCATREQEIAFHKRRYREFETANPDKTYAGLEAAVDAQGSRLRRELESFAFDENRVVTLTNGEWGLAWKAAAAAALPQSTAPWELLSQACGKLYFVIPSVDYFPVVNQLLVMDLAPKAKPLFFDGNESPLLERNDALVAVGSAENNAAIAELEIAGDGVQAIPLRDACGALVVPCSDPREGLATLRRAIRGPHREGVPRARAAV